MNQLGWAADGIARALACGAVELEKYRKPGFVGRAPTGSPTWPQSTSTATASSRHSGVSRPVASVGTTVRVEQDPEIGPRLMADSWSPVGPRLVMEQPEHQPFE